MKRPAVKPVSKRLGKVLSRVLLAYITGFAYERGRKHGKQLNESESLQTLLARARARTERHAEERSSL